MTRARDGVSAVVTRRLALVWALAALVVVAWPAQAQDAYEPDEGIDLAAPIELAELQSHTYHEDDETDLVVIEVKAGTIYTVQTLNLSAGVDTIVGVWLGEFDLFMFDNDGGDELWASKLIMEAPISGLVYIEAVRLGSVGSYDILIEEGGALRDGDGAPDAFEPDDDPTSAQPIVVGAVGQLRTFHRTNNEDWVTVDVVEGEVYQIWTAALVGDVDTLLTVWTEDAVADIARNAPLAEDDDGGPVLSSRVINLRAPYTGQLYISVFNLDGPRSGSYELHVTVGQIGDAYEPDDAQETATPITTDGTPQRHGFHSNDPVDWVRFTAVSDRWYTIWTDNLVGVDTILEVYDENGNWLFWNDDTGAASSSRIADVELPEGTIYVAVTQFLFFSLGVGDYDVMVEATDPDTEAPTGSVTIADARTLDGETFVPKARVVFKTEAEDNHVPRSQIFVGIRNGTDGEFQWTRGQTSVNWGIGRSDAVRTIQVVFADSYDNRSEITTFRVVLDDAAPELRHDPIDSADVGVSLPVTASVTDASLVAAALYYRPGGATQWTRLAMDLEPLAGDSQDVTGEIPAEALTGGAVYYVEATDLFDRVTTFPADGLEDGIGVRAFGTFAEPQEAPAQTWRPFSIPVSMPDGTAQMASTLDRVIAADEWKVMRWVGEDDYADTPRPQMARGKPLWVISKRPYRLSVDESTAPDPSVPAVIDLDAGWNFVANPFPFPVRFGNVEVATGDAGSVSVVDEAAAEYVRPRFWRWDDPSPNGNSADGRYIVEERANRVWEPWSGYWLLAEQAATLTVRPYSELEYDFLLHRPPAAPSKPLWSASLVGRGAGSSASVGIALHRAASWGYDPHDVSQPPSPAGLRLSLVHEGSRYQ
ncbi:MAG: hypothetical protein ABGY41_19305, partial [Candidatus Poribacteria bacterium]